MGGNFLALRQHIFPVHKYLKLCTDELDYNIHAEMKFEKIVTSTARASNKTDKNQKKKRKTCSDL